MKIRDLICERSKPVTQDKQKRKKHRKVKKVLSIQQNTHSAIPNTASETEPVIILVVRAKNLMKTSKPIKPNLTVKPVRPLP